MTHSHTRTLEKHRGRRSIVVRIPNHNTLTRITRRNKERKDEIEKMEREKVSSLLVQGGMITPTPKAPLNVMKHTSLALCLEPL